MSSKVDLHVHSAVSDGSDEVPELLNKIQQSNITTFALTDHDTINGALNMENLVPDGIRFIRGVELSCKTDTAKCHILGYNYDSSNAVFLDFVAEAHDVRINKTHNRLKYLKNAYDIEFTVEEIEELFKNGSPCKPDLAELIRKRLPPTPPGEEPINIYETYFKDLPSGRVNAIRAVKAVKAAGGIAVWAHPLGGTGEKRLTEEKFNDQLDILCNAGLDGLECYYSEYTKEEIAKLCTIANQRNLLVSGGSDYHGTRKPHLHLGMLNKDDLIINEADLTILTLLK